MAAAEKKVEDFVVIAAVVAQTFALVIEVELAAREKRDKTRDQAM